jgi:hypothetical protein
MLKVAVVPGKVAPPGNCVTVQVPDAVGKPVNKTVPVGVVQFG